MIIDELREELNLALACYLSKYPKGKEIPLARSEEIKVLKIMINEKDPILLCEKVQHLCNTVASPFFSFLTFFDQNYFASLFRNVLKQEKFQQSAIFSAMLAEKDQMILNLKNRLAQAQLSKKTESSDEAMQEVSLLKSENSFLYKTIAEMNKTIQIQKSALARTVKAVETDISCRTTFARQTHLAIGTAV